MSLGGEKVTLAHGITKHLITRNPGLGHSNVFAYGREFENNAVLM